MEKILDTELKTETTKVTLQQIQNFFNAANKWLQKPDSQNTELADCIKKIAPQLQMKTTPLQTHSFETKKTLDELMVSMADKHIIEVIPSQNPQQPPQIIHKHEFMPSEGKDSYKEYIEKAGNLSKEFHLEFSKLIMSEVEIEPVYCQRLPPFAILKENEQIPFIGFVVREKKGSQIISIKS